MNWLLTRLREPSTWRVIVWLLTVAGWSLRPDQAEAIVTFGVTLVGLIGVFLPDTPKTVKVELPPIKLQSHAENHPDLPNRRVANDRAGADPNRLRERLTLPAQYPPEHDQRADGPGWNG